MNLQEYEKIPGKNIAIEVIEKNLKPIMKPYIAFTTFMQFYFFGFKFIYGMPMFVNGYSKTIFWLQLLTYVFYEFNMIALFNALNMVMHNKMMYQFTMMTMLQNEKRSYYNIEHEMPQVNIHSPQNLNQLINL